MSPPFVPFRGRISRLLAPAREDDDARERSREKRRPEREREREKVRVERGAGRVQTRGKRDSEKGKGRLASNRTERHASVIFFPSIVARKCAIPKSGRAASLIKFGSSERD